MFPERAVRLSVPHGVYPLLVLPFLVAITCALRLYKLLIDRATGIVYLQSQCLLLYHQIKADITGSPVGSDTSVSYERILGDQPISHQGPPKPRRIEF